MTAARNRVLDALIQSAVDATGAAEGWILVRDNGDLRIAAAAGAHASVLFDITTAAGDGAEGYVLASGQPLALSPRGGDDDLLAKAIGAHLDHQPTSVLCVPCDGDDSVVGALEVVDKQGGGPFSFDDVEMATLLAGIAGVALETTGAGSSVPGPDELGGDLHRLAGADPGRYAAVAGALAALISRG